MAPVLRPIAQTAEPRPTLLSEQVCLRAAQSQSSAIAAHLSVMGHSMSVDTVEVVLKMALPAAGPELNGYDVARKLERDFRWPMDTVLARLVFHTAEALPVARRIETTEWAQRMHFASCDRKGYSSKSPAVEGDEIEWYEQGANGKPEAHVGLVVSLNRAQATMVVRPKDGEAGPHRVIHMEWVYANVTTATYAFEAFDGSTLVLESPELIPVTPPAPLSDICPLDPHGPSVA